MTRHLTISFADKCSIVNMENFHVDFLKDECVDTPLQVTEKSSLLTAGTAGSSSKSPGPDNLNSELK